MNDVKTYLFDNKRNVRFVVRALIAACIFLFGLDFILHRHAYHPLEEIPGFYAIYGFVACVLLVLLAKEMRKLLIRREDYYEQGQVDHDSISEENKGA